MEWKECECQLCDGEAKFKELDTPEQRKYSCPVCLEYVLAFQLEDYPDLKTKVSRYSTEIAKFLREIRKTCDECIEIMLHDGLVKNQNQISLNYLIEKASNVRNLE